MVGGSWGGAGSLERSCFSFNILCGFTVYKFTIEFWILHQWEVARSKVFLLDFPSNALVGNHGNSPPIRLRCSCIFALLSPPHCWLSTILNDSMARMQRCWLLGPYCLELYFSFQWISTCQPSGFILSRFDWAIDAIDAALLKRSEVHSWLKCIKCIWLVTHSM